MKNYINFCLFSMILKNLRVTFYWWIETFFCLFANVGQCRVVIWRMYGICYQTTMQPCKYPSSLQLWNCAAWRICSLQVIIRFLSHLRFKFLSKIFYWVSPRQNLTVWVYTIHITQAYSSLAFQLSLHSIEKI